MRRKWQSTAPPSRDGAKPAVAANSIGSLGMWISNASILVTVVADSQVLNTERRDASDPSSRFGCQLACRPDIKKPTFMHACCSSAVRRTESRTAPYRVCTLLSARYVTSFLISFTSSFRHHLDPGLSGDEWGALTLTESHHNLVHLANAQGSRSNACNCDNSATLDCAGLPNLRLNSLWVLRLSSITPLRRHQNPILVNAEIGGHGSPTACRYHETTIKAHGISMTWYKT